MRLSGSDFIGPPPPLADLWRRTFVELVGAFALVFVGAGTIMSLGPQADAGTLDVALATGLAIAVMVTAVGHISGGHFNPAITFGFILTRRMNAVLGVAYWSPSCSAPSSRRCCSAGSSRRRIATRRTSGRRRVHTIDIGAALVVEALITFFLVWVVFAMTTDERNAYTAVAGLAIGFVIVFGMLLAYPLTGGSFNPARAFGPELVSGSWSDAWIYYVGPLAGGAIAALLYDEVYLRPGPAAVGPPETGVEEPTAGATPRDT